MDEFSLVNTTTILVAKRKSGKSVLLKHLVECERNEFYKIWVICPTESVNGFYSDIVPKECIFDEYNEEWVESLIQNMTKYHQDKNKKPKNVLLILDDCVSDVRLASSKSFSKIFTRGRHIHLGIIVTTQYLNLVPPTCRNNADMLFIGQLNTQGIKLLSDEYKSGNVSQKEFEQIYYKNTSDFQFLVINNNSVKDNDDLDEIYGVIKVDI